MAISEDKKSFVLYCDLKHTVDLLDDISAGKLLKHLLRYVNDENPVTHDPIIKIAFSAIEQQLKRDLNAWRRRKEINAINGRKGGLKSGLSRSKKRTKQINQPLQNLSEAIKNEANEAVNVNVNVNDTVNTNLDSVLAVAAVGSEKVKEVANKVWKDQLWKEQICMGLGVNIEELKKWLALFNSSVASDKISDFGESKYKKMSRGWILSQKAKGVVVETGKNKGFGSSPTLTVIQ